MDRLDAMKVLVAVTEAGSLSGAGRVLRLPLSTVSRKIKDLEVHLGAQLLLRASRQVALTEAGRAYAAAAQRILGEVDAAERAAAVEYSAARGDLVMSAPVVFGRMHLLPVVVAFLRAYPEVAVRLMMSDRVTHLTEDHIDVALRIGHLPDSGLKAIRLGEVRRITCAHPDWLAAHGPLAHPEDLAGQDCISFAGLADGDRWRFGGEVAVVVRARLVVSTAEAALDAAMAGLGVTRVLSYQAGPALAAGRLVEVLGGYASAPLPVSLIYEGQGVMALKLRAFLDFAAPRIRAVLGGPGAIDVDSGGPRA